MRGAHLHPPSERRRLQYPFLSIVGAFMPTGQCLAAAGEYSVQRACFPLPDPGIVSNGQCVRRRVSLAIGKLASELTTR